MAGRVLIGTSGFSYPHWRGILYPEGVPQKRWLERYCEVFRTVEINYTFYRLPKESLIAGWYERTPADFVFALKASRVITHIRKLADAEDAARRFFEALVPLKEKLGPVLFQLPPSAEADNRKLGTFLTSLPEHLRYAFEFRHSSWFTDVTYDLLKDHDAALVLHDYGHIQWPVAITAGWTYLRLHGTSGRYSGEYGERGLRAWSENLGRWAAEGLDACIFFNNDFEGGAVRDAVTLAEMVPVACGAGGEEERKR